MSIPPGAPPPFHRSFLVTSNGAYGDSGLGTGGLTCVHEGEAHILDKIDSTALHHAGDTLYRFARGQQALAGYRRDGLRWTVRLPEFGDIHDVWLQEGRFVCVSTSTNEVLWLDAEGRITRRRAYEGQGDAWHLNCLWEDGGKLYLSAFGRFATHRGWVGQCTGTGFVMEVESGEEVVSGLNGPHNPRLIDGQWVVCDSHRSSLVLQDATGQQQVLPLGGFTRGLAYDAHYLYVGESANRKSAIPPEASSVAIVDRRTLEVVHRVRIPFPEIYEVVLLDPTWAEAMVQEPERYQLDRSDERIRALENQVELGLREVEAQKARAEKWRRRKSLQQGLTELKRTVQARITGGPWKW